MGAQAAPVGATSTPKAEWVTGGRVDRKGLAAFVHIVRSDDDPEPMTRKERQAAGIDSESWKRDLKTDQPKWAKLIAQLLADGIPRTFNAIVLELTDRRYTADIAMHLAPDKALWQLVSDQAIEHTLDSPIRFRARTSKLWRGWTRVGDHGECGTCYRRHLPTWQLETWADPQCALCMFEHSTSTPMNAPKLCDNFGAAWRWKARVHKARAKFEDMPLACYAHESSAEFDARAALLGYDDDGNRKIPQHPDLPEYGYWMARDLQPGQCSECGSVVNHHAQLCPQGWACDPIAEPPPQPKHRQGLLFA